MSDLIREDKSQVRILKLNRPLARNAYSDEMVSLLVLELERAQDDPNVRVIVLTGNGEAFCAGGDLKSMQTKSSMFAGEPNELRERYQGGIQKISHAMIKLNKPIVAMINGPAVGAGCDLACMCDFRIASTKASFAQSFVKVGLVPGDGGAYFLIRLIGFAKASEMYLTCQTYSAEQVLNFGLINELVLPEVLEKRTLELAQHLSSLPPIALQMTKNALKNAYHQSLQEHLDLVSAYQGITQRTSDHFKAIDGLLSRQSNIFDHR